MNYDLTRSGILAFMCGFVDTIVFVHMGGLFVAHVTGNFVLLGATSERREYHDHDSL